MRKKKIWKGQGWTRAEEKKKGKMSENLLFTILIVCLFVVFAVVVLLTIITALKHYGLWQISIFDRYNPKSFLVFTDLETDDMVALYVLAKRFGKSKKFKFMFVVGEGDSRIKAIRMNKYVKKLGFENAEVVQGYSSNKNFTYDGKDVMTEEEFAILFNKAEEYDKEGEKKKIYEFLLNESPFIISIKPPRELMEMFKNGHPMYRRVFKRCIFAGYMSFNLRCLMNEYKPDLVNFLKAFKICFFYESHYAVGSDNIITGKDFSFEKLPELIKRVMTDWNRHMIVDCKETIEECCSQTIEEFYSKPIEKLSTYTIEELYESIEYDESMNEREKERMKRNVKKLFQILKNDYKQFVNADGGLLISLLQYCAPYKWMSLKYDLKSRNGYPILGIGKDVKIIKPKDPKKYREFQVRMMKLVFGIE